MTRNERRAGLAVAGLALLLGAAVLVRFPPGEYGFYPVCPVHAWTGLLCPGCGGTRALAALLRGNVAEAWRWNALVTSLVPFGAAYAAVMVGRIWRGVEGWVKVPGVVWGCLGVVAGVFTVWRNVG